MRGNPYLPYLLPSMAPTEQIVDERDTVWPILRPRVAIVAIPTIKTLKVPDRGYGANGPQPHTHPPRIPALSPPDFQPGARNPFLSDRPPTY